MSNTPERIWAVYYEDISSQTSEVYAQDNDEGFVQKPTEYIRSDLCKPAPIKVDVCKGQAGIAVYVNEERIYGPRHNGLMKTLVSYYMPCKYINKDDKDDN